MHYTIQDVPRELYDAIVARAAAEHKTFDQVFLETVSRELGIECSDAEIERFRVIIRE